MTNNVFAIILAAGNSSRMHGKDKILEKLSNGMEVIINTIYRFDVIDPISKIIVAIKAESVEKLTNLIAKYSFQKDIYIINGGDTRTQSLFLAYDFINSNFDVLKEDYYLIHDGARPLIFKQDILNCLKLAYQYGAVSLGESATDTVKKVIKNEKNIKVIKTLDRNELMFIKTPQIFKVDILDQAIKNAKDNDLEFTDDCQLVEAIGHKVYILEGMGCNIKITNKKDLWLINKIL